MKNKIALYELHDIEEFLSSASSFYNCELIYLPSLNHRGQKILKIAARKQILARPLSKFNFAQLVQQTFQNSAPPRLRNLLLFVPSQQLESKTQINELWPLLNKKSIVLILAGITDPHNLGAIMRSADLFEVTALIIPRRRTATINDTVRRVASGASNHVKIFQVANLLRIIEQFKKLGFWVYSADLGGSPIVEVDLTGPIAVVFGSEGKGIPLGIMNRVDGVLTIPTGGHISSCNVSVSAGIVLYELTRQRGFS